MLRRRIFEAIFLAPIIPPNMMVAEEHMKSTYIHKLTQGKGKKQHLISL